MRKTKYFYWFLVLSLVLFCSVILGCAKPPTEEIIKAEKAVDEARQKEAALYVQDVFTKAEESLKKAKDFVAVKKYKEAKVAAEETVKLAQQAVSLVEPNKVKMKEEAEKLMQEVQKELDDLKTSVAKAIKKKAPINREEIQNMIGKWEVDMATIKDKLQSQQIKQAYDDLKTMKEQVNAQKEGVTTALEAKAAKK